MTIQRQVDLNITPSLILQHWVWIVHGTWWYIWSTWWGRELEWSGGRAGQQEGRHGHWGHQCDGRERECHRLHRPLLWLGGDHHHDEEGQGAHLPVQVLICAGGLCLGLHLGSLFCYFCSFVDLWQVIHMKFLTLFQSFSTRWSPYSYQNNMEKYEVIISRIC